MGSGIDALVVERPRAEAVGGKLRPEPAEPGVDVELGGTVGGGRRDHPHEAVLLAQRQRGERGPLGAHAGKAAFVGDAHHPAVEVVGPGMVGAHEEAGLAAALRHLGAAVPAHVEERAQLAVARRARRGSARPRSRRCESAGRLPLGGKAHQQRVLAEQDLPLARRVLRIAVDRHVVAPGRVGHARWSWCRRSAAAASEGRSVACRFIWRLSLASCAATLRASCGVDAILIR